MCGRDAVEYVVKRDAWKRLARLPVLDDAQQFEFLLLDGTLYAFARSGPAWRIALR